MRADEQEPDTRPTVAGEEAHDDEAHDDEAHDDEAHIHQAHWW